MTVGNKTLLAVFMALLVATIVSGSPVKAKIGQPVNSDQKSSSPVSAFAFPRPWRARDLRIGSDELESSSDLRSPSKSLGTHVDSHEGDSTEARPELVTKFWGPLPWAVENV
ncbi:secreted protein [Melampsora americana]|nr:secreted protein [Melampsora americana]